MSKILLTEPDQISAGTNTYEVSSFTFRWTNDPYVNIGLSGEGGLIKTIIYTGNDAVDVLFATTFAIGLLEKLILDRLLNDGKLQGTIQDE